MTPLKIFIGWDTHQIRTCNVAMFSAAVRSRVALDIRRLAMEEMMAKGLYARPTTIVETAVGSYGGYWDEISQAPMSTGHAIARFLVPVLCEYSGLALFTDGDVLFRRDVSDLFALADPKYAVQVVQHAYAPIETRKMDGQVQTQYARKNWSSVVLWHAGHPANRALTVDLVNTVPGRDLHRFCWLDDALVGALPPTFNHLVGVSAPDTDPAIVHFTEGTPDMAGYEHVSFADEWYAIARACGYRLSRPPRPSEAVA